MSELGRSSSTAHAGILSVAAAMPLWLMACTRTLTRWTSLLRQLLCPRVFPGVKAYLVRWMLAVPGLFILALVQSANALGLLLDEILFRSYRRVSLRRPVFILGVPRSGTTHTHHLLSSDQRFTTVTLWEALFAPSISQRHGVAALVRLDRSLGGQLARLMKLLEQRLQGSLDSVHPTGLHAPEEDFLLLISSLDCFLLVLVFPECRWLWALARADDPQYGQQGRRVMKRYRRLLQRHVYFHGEQLQMLSKNASFAGLSQTLAREFPDSAIIVCERDAQMAVRSQLRSLQDVRQQLYIDRVCPGFESCLLDTLHFYYRNLDLLKERLSSTRCVSVPLWRLSRQPRQTMQMIYEQLALGSIEPLHEALCALEACEHIRPATSEPDCQIRGNTGPLDRFYPWHHAPENRL